MPKFSVQLHNAKKAGPHWDLRLEKGNVAKSFAIPKLKLPETGEKIFAAEVPDHSIGYMTWEGTIPKGEYGTGTVEVYDSGTYDVAGWDDEKIDLTFHGKHLNGRYVFIKTKTGWLITKPKEQTLEEVKMGELPDTEEEFLKLAFKVLAEEEFRFDPNSTENEGRWRLIDPKSFNQDTIRRWNIWKGVQAPGIQFVMGVDKRDREWKPQAIRFDKSTWSEEEASKWWEVNKGSFDKEWRQTDWDEWMQKRPREVFTEYKQGATEELPETYDIHQCSWCRRFFDKYTKEYVEAPIDVQVVSHGMCLECYQEALKELDELRKQRKKEGSLLPETEEEFLEKYSSLLLEAVSGRCDKCGKYSKHLHKHRLTPGYEGGEYVEENIQLLCDKCHKKLHHEAGDFEMGGEWKHENLLKELGPKGYSKWQAERGKERQQSEREEVGEKGYSKLQKERAMKRWHPKKKAGLDAPKTVIFDLDTLLDSDFELEEALSPPHPEAKKVLDRFTNAGFYIIIKVGGKNASLAIEHLVLHKIPFDDVISHSQTYPQLYFDGDWPSLYNQINKNTTFPVKVSQYMYDPDKSLLIDRVTPLYDTVQPDYPDPAYWGTPTTLIKRKRRKKKKLDVFV